VTTAAEEGEKGDPCKGTVIVEGRRCIHGRFGSAKSGVQAQEKTAGEGEKNKYPQADAAAAGELSVPGSPTGERKTRAVLETDN